MAYVILSEDRYVAPKLPRHESCTDKGRIILGNGVDAAEIHLISIARGSDGKSGRGVSVHTSSGTFGARRSVCDILADAARSHDISVIEVDFFASRDRSPRNHLRIPATEFVARMG